MAITTPSENSCPCCGHPLPTDVAPELAKLGPVKRRIFQVISKHSPRGIEAERVCEIVYADHRDGGPMTWCNNLHVHVNQMNKLLKPFDIQIQGSTQSRWGNVYRVVRPNT